MKFTKVILSVALMVCAFLVVIAGINTDNPDANPKWSPLNATQLQFPLLRGSSTSMYTGPTPTYSNSSLLFAGFSSDESAGSPRLNDVWKLTNANGLGGTATWS